MTAPMTAPWPAPQAPLDLADIQGNVLRGYRQLLDVRYLAVSLGDAAGGRTLLSVLLDGAAEIPAVERADEWDERPTACLHVMVTAPGLAALGVPADVLATFPVAFQQGSASRSRTLAADPASPYFRVGIGDIGDSDPEHWVIGGLATPEIHVLISIFSNESAQPRRDAITAALRGVFANAGVVERSVLDGNGLGDGIVHFGYRDGIGQPQIDGAPGRRKRDMQPAVATGDVLLGKGYVNTYRGNFLGDIPPALGDNGTYVAFRMLEQDVDAFEAFITRTGERFDMDPELVAAKLCGRWRTTGVPLSLSPADGDLQLADDRLNEFDYASTLDHPANFDDADGVRCPFGAHIRRMNPRGGPVAGIQHNRRIIRRGVPYGPAYDPTHPNDGQTRGLLGAFICADLASQFEFLQQVWANTDISAPGVRGTRDPIIGWQPEVGGKIALPTGDARGVLMANDVPRLVTTRGSLYLFMPGIGGLRTVVAGAW